MNSFLASCLHFIASDTFILKAVITNFLTDVLFVNWPEIRDGRISASFVPIRFLTSWFRKFKVDVFLISFRFEVNIVYIAWLATGGWVVSRDSRWIKANDLRDIFVGLFLF